MSPAEDRRALRRILLALDALPTPATLAEAVRLARRLDAELTALFVEDINLLHLAQHPFARHTSLLSGVAQPVDMALMESILHAQAAQARRAIEDVALRAGLRWSFRTVRGPLAETVIAAAADQDLLLIGWTTRGPGRQWPGQPLTIRLRRRPGGHGSSTVRAIAGRVRRPVLLLRDGDILDHPVAVLFDGSAGATTALHVAAALAAVSRETLIVLLAGDGGLAEQAAAILRNGPVIDIAYRALPATTIEAICSARAEAGCGVVVLDADSPLLQAAGDNPLMAFSCPVLLAR